MGEGVTSIQFAVLSLLVPLELFVYLHLIIGILSLYSSDSLATFKSRLKSHLFFSAYHV